MIPKVIHRIYFDIGLGPIENNSIFMQSVEAFGKLMPDYKQIIWSREEVENLLNEKAKSLIPFWRELRYDIQRIDVTRFILLYFYGGFFADLDLIPVKRLDPLLNTKILTYKPHYRKTVVGVDKKSEIGFDFWGCEPGNEMWLFVLQKCQKNYKSKKDMEIYKTWKARFVLQTTGPYFLNRTLKNSKYWGEIVALPLIYDVKHDSNENQDGFYLLQHMTGTWLNDEFYERKKQK